MLSVELRCFRSDREHLQIYHAHALGQCTRSLVQCFLGSGRDLAQWVFSRCLKTHTFSRYLPKIHCARSSLTPENTVPVTAYMAQEPVQAKLHSWEDRYRGQVWSACRNNWAVKESKVTLRYPKVVPVTGPNRLVSID